ncbi:DUF5655 domain-containing protein [uncultured Mailhella sp.]|uniref:DUF5655 domain-containing protein n=1 Tax=uncultured Mailhella sp. TaxID=1981031 RepID=UPI00320ABB9C
MSEIKLYDTNGQVTELISSSVLLERELQTLIENNMATFFGVRFLKSEYSITGGRMDSIGIDENNCPVIFEYKRNSNENVINQGLFYLDWLLDHKADFKLLVMTVLGKDAADLIDWSAPCVICVAHKFNKYDIHAVDRMQVNIKLVEYRKYNNGMLLFEHLNTPSTSSSRNNDTCHTEPVINKSQKHDTSFHIDKLESISPELKELYENICNYIESLGDDVASNQLKQCLAYRKLRNFACIEIFSKQLKLFLTLDPSTVELTKDFTRDVSNVGHHGTGDVEVIIRNSEDFEKAKPLIERAYNEG